MTAINSLASVVGVSETATPVTAAISELDPNTGQEKVGGGILNTAIDAAANFASFGNSSRSRHQAFQYFPEQISDSKSPEWSRKSVPGGSGPIMTFINGGERVISFAAVFTQEENPEPLGLLQSALSGAGELGLQDLPLIGQTRKDTVDVAAALAYLRGFTYPDYPQGVAQPPPYAIVYLPNSGIIGHAGGPLDSVVGAMIQCDVLYEKLHRNGAPRIAVVNLAFVEVVQTGPNWRFTGRSDIDRILQAQGREPYQREVVGADQGGGLISPLFGNLI